MTDPGDTARTLDTFDEIKYTKTALSVEDALAELKFAVSPEKRM